MKRIKKNTNIFGAERKFYVKMFLLLLMLLFTIIYATDKDIVKAAENEKLETGDFYHAATVRLNKSYTVTGFKSEKAGFARLNIKKATKVSVQLSGINKGVVHLQIYKVKNHYTSKLIHDMQVFAPSDSEIEKNTKKYTWDQQSADSMYLTLRPGVYCLRFESSDDVYSGTTAAKKCRFRVKKV